MLTNTHNATAAILNIDPNWFYSTSVQKRCCNCWINGGTYIHQTNNEKAFLNHSKERINEYELKINRLLKKS